MTAAAVVEREVTRALTTVRLADLLDREQVAAVLGIQAASVTRYRQRDPSFPAPVRVFGGVTPVWLSRDVAAWAAARPGRGAGGGRPRKQAEPKPKPKPPAKRRLGGSRAQARAELLASRRAKAGGR